MYLSGYTDAHSAREWQASPPRRVIPYSAIQRAQCMHALSSHHLEYGTGACILSSLLYISIFKKKNTSLGPYPVFVFFPFPNLREHFTSGEMEKRNMSGAVMVQGPKAGRGRGCKMRVQYQITFLPSSQAKRTNLWRSPVLRQGREVRGVLSALFGTPSGEHTTRCSR